MTAFFTTLVIAFLIGLCLICYLITHKVDDKLMIKIPLCVAGILISGMLIGLILGFLIDT